MRTTLVKKVKLEKSEFHSVDESLEEKGIIGVTETKHRAHFILVMCIFMQR